MRGLCERSQVAPAAAGNNLQKPVGAPPSGCVGDDNLRFVSALAYWHESVMELMLQMRNTFMFVCGVCVCVFARRCFTFSIGQKACRRLVEALATVSKGTAEFLADGERLQPKVLDFFFICSSQAAFLSNVTVSVATQRGAVMFFSPRR